MKNKIPKPRFISQYKKRLWPKDLKFDPDDDCICAEWDGRGVSTCGVPCPVHSKQTLQQEMEREFDEEFYYSFCCGGDYCIDHEKHDEELRNDIKFFLLKWMDKAEQKGEKAGERKERERVLKNLPSKEYGPFNGDTSAMDVAYGWNDCLDKIKDSITNNTSK